MNTTQQARGLMMRHHKMIKNRQQSMLNRTASEIGMDVTNSDYCQNMKGTPIANIATGYDRNNSAIS